MQIPEDEGKEPERKGVKRRWRQREIRVGGRMNTAAARFQTTRTRQQQAVHWHQQEVSHSERSDISSAQSRREGALTEKVQTNGLALLELFPVSPVRL